MERRRVFANGRGAKIDENQIHVGQVDEYVLRLDVAVNDAQVVQIDVDAHELSEKVSRLGFVETSAMLRFQIVEQVHAVQDLWHDDDPFVLLLEELDHPDNAWHMVTHLV